MTLPELQTSHPAVTNTRKKPARAWYVLSLMLFVCSTTGSAAIIVDAVRTFPQGTQFLVPGSTTLTTDKSGTFVIWDEVSTFFEGRSYLSSDELPAGLTITARRPASGDEVLFSPTEGALEAVGTVRRKAIGEIRAPTPGVYTITVTGSFPDRIFYVRRSAADDICRTVGTVTLLGLGGWVLAPVIGVVVLIRRSASAGGGERPVAEVPRTDEERTYAMFCHLGGLCGFFVPFGSIAVPLILWLTKKESSAFIDQHGRAAVNFQLSLMIYSVASALLILVVVGVFLLAALWLFNLVIVVVAAIRAKAGEEYRYPLTIRFIR